MFKKVNPRTFHQWANETALVSFQPQEKGGLQVLICGSPPDCDGKKGGGRRAGIWRPLEMVQVQHPFLGMLGEGEW